MHVFHPLGWLFVWILFFEVEVLSYLFPDTHIGFIFIKGNKCASIESASNPVFQQLRDLLCFYNKSIVSVGGVDGIEFCIGHMIGHKLLFI